LNNKKRENKFPSAIISSKETSIVTMQYSEKIYIGVLTASSQMLDATRGTLEDLPEAEHGLQN
jgi:hypothetical protein